MEDIGRERGVSLVTGRYERGDGAACSSPVLPMSSGSRTSSHPIETTATTRPAPNVTPYRILVRLHDRLFPTEDIRGEG
jgi:hypothetical protein